MHVILVRKGICFVCVSCEYCQENLQFELLVFVQLPEDTDGSLFCD